MTAKCRPPANTADGTVFTLAQPSGKRAKWKWRNKLGRWPDRWTSVQTGISHPPHFMTRNGWTIAESPTDG